MIKLLDHGYIKLIETWGSDERIIEAARMSTDKGFLGWDIPCKECNGSGAALAIHFADGSAPCLKCSGRGTSGDEKLLAYLYNNKHMTPFEMGGMIIEVQAPIFVFREWHRHRTQSYNELSARYTPLPDINYIPAIDRLQISGGKNKQAQGSQLVTNAIATNFQVDLEELYIKVESLYQEALKNGIPKELARLVIPVGRYSRMRASANLRNWLGFLTLRMDEAAQWEIRQYANEVGNLIEQSFPRTWSLFKGELDGKTKS